MKRTASPVRPWVSFLLCLCFGLSAYWCFLHQSFSHGEILALTSLLFFWLWVYAWCVAHRNRSRRP